MSEALWEWIYFCKSVGTHFCLRGHTQTTLTGFSHLLTPLPTAFVDKFTSQVQVGQCSEYIQTFWFPPGPPLSTKESTWFVCDILELDIVPSMSDDCGSLPDVPVQNDESPNNVSNIFKIWSMLQNSTEFINNFLVLALPSFVQYYEYWGYFG